MKTKSLNRRVFTREPKRKFVIFTEGRNTEPEYLDALSRSTNSSIIDIEIIDVGGVPTTLLREAKARYTLWKSRKTNYSFEKGDEIWIVFDKDDHPLVDDVINLCEVYNIGVAFSNPCFELWLILHLQDYNKPDDRFVVQKFLRNLLGFDSKKKNDIDFNELIDSVVSAEERAQKLEYRRMQEGAERSAPLTTVYKLTRKIRGIDQ